MTSENEQRLREALLLLTFSSKELEGLSEDELRVLAAIQYVPPPTVVDGRGGDPLRPRHHQMLAALLDRLRRPRTIAPPRPLRRRGSAVRPRGLRRRRPAHESGPPNDPEPT